MVLAADDLLETDEMMKQVNLRRLSGNGEEEQNSNMTEAERESYLKRQQLGVGLTT